jgi:general secretion pathway protein H
MRTSATGEPRRNGFTLIELLVVLTIIGLMSAAVVLAIPDPRGSLASEAARFAARSKAAQTQAILDSRAMAVRVTESGYVFERRDAAGWQAVAAPPFAQQGWTEGTSAVTASRILFDSTGLAEPAAVELQRGDERVTINFGHDGTIRVRA